jgi:hypothetical protein
MNFRKKTMDNWAGIDGAWKTTTLCGLLNIGLSHLVLFFSAGNLLHWVIPSCPVEKHWVDMLLHWVIPSCPVQEHWVDILLHWVIPSCPVQEHWVDMLLHWVIPSCPVEEHWVDMLLHWVIPSCPVQEHWVDIQLHWAIPPCPVQEQWVDILLNWVILSCPLIVHYVVKKIVMSTRHDTSGLRLGGVRRCLRFRSWSFPCFILVGSWAQYVA